MGKGIFRQRNALAAGLAGLLAAGCGAGHEADCLKSNGPVVTQRRAVSRRVRLVQLYDNVDLTIVPDTATYAEVRAGQNVVDDVELTSPGGPDKLVIRNTSRCNWVRSYNTPREVRLHVPHLRDVSLYGSGRLRNEGQWQQDTLFVRLNGVGDIDFNLNSVYLHAYVFEAGTLTLRGQTQQVHPGLSSTGVLYAQDLRAQYCFVTANNFWYGDAYVYASTLLAGTVNGHGTLYYRGSPAALDVKGTNTGRLVPQ